jgi:dipeptidyl aminopeptidase/acylaminoacyl peptidase
MKSLILSVSAFTLLFGSTSAQAQKTDNPITMEQIMAHPDWRGPSPYGQYWSDDSKGIYYSTKRVGSVISDLYMQPRAGGAAAKIIPLSDLHKHVDNNRTIRADGTLEAYVFKGNIFLKNRRSGLIQQITHSSAREHNPQFLKGHRLAYKIGNVFFSYDMANKNISELVSLKASDAPKGDVKPKGFIAKDQEMLIDYIAKQRRVAGERRARNEKLEKENDSLAPKAFYFGKGVRIISSSLSPNGDMMVVATAKKSPPSKTDLMPQYITKNGDITMKRVRKRIESASPNEQTAYLLNLADHKKYELKFDSLPGYDEDVLAKVKAENFKAQGKKYKSKKSPRDIMVNRGAVWQKDGKAAAMMLRAYDNKDRWIVSVDLKKHKFNTLERLHDDAWVNSWAFTEFGWLNNSETLYFLSEKSGYGHLYLKEKGTKIRQLTKGKYVVSNLTLSKNDGYIYYQANKKHSGIYEIYRVNLKNGKNEALTDLNGMTDYNLSPDETKLLLSHSTSNMPTELYVQDIAKGSKASRLTHTVTKKFTDLPWITPKFISIKSKYSKAPINAKIFYPKGYDPKAKKYRAVSFAHGAGYLQDVHAGFSGYSREHMFNNLLAHEGYVVIGIDFRASRGYGRDWRTAIYRNMGEPEVNDFKATVDWLVKNANVDRKRIGTYGGSYGGFTTLMALFTAPDLFQAGAAQRLVSDWAYYNAGYTSNILNTPKDDPIAFRRSSPIYHAQGLKNHLLINAPMVDDNVFFVDTVRLVQRFIELEKENFETAIYPIEPHGFREASSWLSEYRKIYKLFDEKL